MAVSCFPSFRVAHFHIVLFALFSGAYVVSTSDSEGPIGTAGGFGARGDGIADVLLDPFPENDAEKEQERVSFTLLLLLGLMILSSLTAFLLRNTGANRFLHESGAAILWGAFVGLLIRLSSEVEVLQGVVRFDSDVFFFVLLPPIIFESGFTMKRRVFFRNTSSVLAFAFIGTLFSAIVFGTALYALVAMGLTFQPLSILECMVFGSLASATDPVTVLAIFKALQVDKNLYANVFGESVFNDAVAIVLFRVVISFESRAFSVLSLLLAVVLFFVIFVGSLLIGTAVGLSSSLLFKYVSSLKRYPTLQTLMLLLFAYGSYLLADALQLSGIVSVLFCGVSMAHYTYENLSHRSQEMSHGLVKFSAFIAEMVVFVYLGLAVFSFQFEYDAGLIVWSIALCLVTRIHVFPLSYAINVWRRRRFATNIIPGKHMVIIWFAGLRGAIAFALSLEVDTPHAQYILSSTLCIVLVTVLLMGSATSPLLKCLDIRMGPMSPEEIEAMGEEPPSRWQRLDRRYFKPFFIRHYRGGGAAPGGGGGGGGTDSRHGADVEGAEASSSSSYYQSSEEYETPRSVFGGASSRAALVHHRPRVSMELEGIRSSEASTSHTHSEEDEAEEDGGGDAQRTRVGPSVMEVAAEQRGVATVALERGSSQTLVEDEALQVVPL